MTDDNDIARQQEEYDAIPAEKRGGIIPPAQRNAGYRKLGIKPGTGGIRQPKRLIPYPETAVAPARDTPRPKGVNRRN